MEKLLKIISIILIQAFLLVEVAPGYQISTGTDAGTSRENIQITTLAPRVTLHQENLHSVIMRLTEDGGLSIKDVTYPDEFMKSPEEFNSGVPKFKRIISAKILKYSALSLKNILLRLVSELDVEYERIDKDNKTFAHPILIGGQNAIEVITERLKDIGQEEYLLEVLDEINSTTNNGVICWRGVLSNLNNIITEKSMSPDIYEALIKEADKMKDPFQAGLLWEVFLNGGLDALFAAINAVEKNNTIAYSGLAFIINDKLITRLSPQQARVLFNAFEQAVIEFDDAIESNFFWNEKVCQVILAIIKLQKEHIGVFNEKFVNRLCALLEKREVKGIFRKSIIEILAHANVPLQKRSLVLQDTADILGDYFDALVSLLPKRKADLQRTNTYLRKIKDDAQFFSNGVFQLIKDKKLTLDELPQIETVARVCGVLTATVLEYKKEEVLGKEEAALRQIMPVLVNEMRLEYNAKNKLLEERKVFSDPYVVWKAQQAGVRIKQAQEIMSEKLKKIYGQYAFTGFEAVAQMRAAGISMEQIEDLCVKIRNAASRTYYYPERLAGVLAESGMKIKDIERVILVDFPGAYAKVREHFDGNPLFNVASDCIEQGISAEKMLGLLLVAIPASFEDKEEAYAIAVSIARLYGKELVRLFEQAGFDSQEIKEIIYLKLPLARSKTKSWEYMEALNKALKTNVIQTVYEQGIDREEFLDVLLNKINDLNKDERLVMKFVQGIMEVAKGRYIDDLANALDDQNPDRKKAARFLLIEAAKKNDSIESLASMQNKVIGKYADIKELEKNWQEVRSTREFLLLELFERYAGEGSLDENAAMQAFALHEAGLTEEQIRGLLREISAKYQQPHFAQQAAAIVRAMIEKGIGFEKTKKFLLQEIFSVYSESEANNVCARIKDISDGQSVEILQAALGDKDSTRAAEFLLMEIPLLYGAGCAKIVTSIHEIIKNNYLSDLLSLGIDPKKTREFLLFDIPLRHGADAHIVAEQLVDVINSDLFENMAAIVNDKARLKEFLFIELPQIAGLNYTDCAKAAEEMLVAGIDIDIAKLLIEKHIAKYGEKFLPQMRKVLTFICSNHVEISKNRNEFAKTIALRLPGVSILIEACLESMLLGLNIVSGKKLLHYLNAKDKERQLIVMLLDANHGSVFRHFEPFLATLNPAERADFLNNVFGQIPGDKSTDSNDEGSHQRIWQILQLLNEREADAPDWKQRLLAADLKDPLFVHLKTDLLEDGVLFKKWKDFERVKVLINLLNHKEMLEKINNYLLDETDEGKALYDYFRFLIMYSSMRDYSALTAMIMNPRKFLGLNDSETSSFLHGAMKPSRMLDFDYIDLAARELIDGLILGKFDDLQVLRPYSISLNIADIDMQLSVLRGGKLINYILDNQYAQESVLRDILLKFLAGELKLMEKDKAENKSVDATREKLVAQAHESLLNNEHFGFILNKIMKFRFDITKLVDNGLELPCYKLKIIPKSDPQAIMTGSEAPSCMYFGSGKNNVYMFNLNTGFFILAKVVAENGSMKERILATSVITVDRKLRENVKSIMQQIEAKGLKGVNLRDVLGDSFIDGLSTQVFIAADNVEASPSVSRSRFEHVVKAAYGKFFEEYLKRYGLTRAGAVINREKILVGISYNDFLGNLPENEANNYLMQVPVAYSDKSLGQQVNVLGLKREQETVPKQQFSGIRAISYEDTLEVGFINNSLFSDTGYKRHFTQLGNELMAIEYNQALKGDRRKNLSLGYYENGRLQGYVIAYAGYDDHREEEVIYISDLAVLPEKAKESELLCDALLESVNRAVRDFKNKYHTDIKVIFDATLGDAGSYRLLLGQDEFVWKEKEQERLKKYGVTVKEEIKQSDGRVQCVLSVEAAAPVFSGKKSSLQLEIVDWSQLVEQAI